MYIYIYMYMYIYIYICTERHVRYSFCVYCACVKFKHILSWCIVVVLTN